MPTPRLPPLFLLALISCTSLAGPDGPKDPARIAGIYAITLTPDPSLPGAHCPGPDAMLYSKPYGGVLIECSGARGVNQFSANGDTMYFRRPVSATEPYAFWSFVALKDTVLVTRYSGDCQGLPGSGGLDNCRREFGTSRWRRIADSLFP